MYWILFITFRIKNCIAKRSGWSFLLLYISTVCIMHSYLCVYVVQFKYRRFFFSWLSWYVYQPWTMITIKTKQQQQQKEEKRKEKKICIMRQHNFIVRRSFSISSKCSILFYGLYGFESNTKCRIPQNRTKSINGKASPLIDIVDCRHFEYSNRVIYINNNNDNDIDSLNSPNLNCIIQSRNYAQNLQFFYAQIEIKKWMDT